MTTPTCPFCHEPFEVADLLSRMVGYATLTDSGNARCPHCDKELEFRVRSQALELGYTYFGGSMHFESCEIIQVPGLQQHRTGAEVTIELRGVTYPPPKSG